MSAKQTGAKAEQQAIPAENISFNDRLNDFMHANRKAFLALGILVLVAVVGLGAYSLVARNVASKATLALEGLEAKYQDWGALEEAQKADGAAELLALADTVVGKYGKRYAAARAAVVKAEVLYATADLPGAEKAYAAVQSSFPKSHLAPVALANAASIAEDRGDSEAALAYLAKVEEQYPEAPGIGRVTLAVGRIHESTKNYDKAMAAYARLVASGDESDWTKLAHDRIILLKSRGLAQ